VIPDGTPAYPRSPAADLELVAPTDQSAAAAACCAHSETRSPATGSPCARPFRDTRNSRQIILIGLSGRKYARRIFAIVSLPASPTWPPYPHGSHCGPTVPGVPIGRRSPRNGVLIPCRFTRREPVRGVARIGADPAGRPRRGDRPLLRRWRAPSGRPARSCWSVATRPRQVAHHRGTAGRGFRPSRISVCATSARLSPGQRAVSVFIARAVQCGDNIPPCGDATKRMPLRGTVRIRRCASSLSARRRMAISLRAGPLRRPS